MSGIDEVLRNNEYSPHAPGYLLKIEVYSSDIDSNHVNEFSGLSEEEVHFHIGIAKMFKKYELGIGNFGSTAVFSSAEVNAAWKSHFGEDCGEEYFYLDYLDDLIGTCAGGLLWNEYVGHTVFFVPEIYTNVTERFE